MFTDYYAEQSCTAGRSSFITGQCDVAHRPLQGRRARRRRSGCRRKTRRSPSCSSRSATPPASSARTISATATSTCRRCTASTSSSATSTTSTPRRSRRTATIRRDPKFKEMFGPRGVLRCKATRPGRPDRAAAIGPRRQADDRGHRPADQEADGDDRRRDLGRGHRLHQAAGEGRQAVLLLVQQRRACTCGRMCAAEHRSPPGLTAPHRVRRRHGRARRHRRHAAQDARRPRHRRTTRSCSTRPTTART